MVLEGGGAADFSGGGSTGELFRVDEHPLELQSEEFEFDGNVEISTATNHDHKDGGGGGGEGEDGEDDAAEEEVDGEDDLEEEDDEEQGYRFRFSGDMDPLSFTKQDSSGLQLYEQFERLEHQYQALAAEKRNAHPTLGLPQPRSYHRFLINATTFLLSLVVILPFIELILLLHCCNLLKL